jgi:hypothetical protein
LNNKINHGISHGENHMTTPSERHYLPAPPRPRREDHELQFDRNDLPTDLSRREQTSAPDCLALLEAELQAFQQELRYLEAALAAR